MGGTRSRLIARRSLRYKATMNIVEKIRAFIIRLSPAPVCDPCVAERLELQQPYVAKVMRELAGQAGFETRVDQCALCSVDKRVVGAR